MAEQIDENTARAPAKGRNSKLLLGLVSVVPVVTILAFFLVTKVVNPRFESSALADAAESVEKEPDKKESYMYELGTVLANPMATSTRRIMKVGVCLELASKSVVEDIEKSKLKLQHQLLMILSSKKLDEICSPQGKAAVREEVKSVFISELGFSQGELREVYFSEFVIQ